MSDLSPLSGEERKLDFGAVRSVDDQTRTDIGTTGVIHRAAGQLGQTDCHPENLLRTEWDRRTCAVGPEAEITVIRIDSIVQP